MNQNAYQNPFQRNDFMGGDDGSIVNCCGGGGQCGYKYCPQKKKCISVNEYSHHQCFKNIIVPKCPSNWIDNYYSGWLSDFYRLIH